MEERLIESADVLKKIGKNINRINMQKCLENFKEIS